MAEKIFPEGVRVFKPRQGAPNFVKGSVVISPNALVAWLKKNPDFLKEYKGEKQLNLDLLEGKDGGLYLSVNTYQKQGANVNDDLPF